MSSFATPKSSSFACPSAPTRMFPGLRSRCTIRRECAYATASAISRKSVIRPSSGSRSAAAVTVVPSTYSITKYGRPSGVVPPSIRRAIRG
ncbi:MAG: hypothetical protein R3B49_01920 [Phycisphaerales bacterium]